MINSNRRLYYDYFVLYTRRGPVMYKVYKLLTMITIMIVIIDCICNPFGKREQLEICFYHKKVAEEHVQCHSNVPIDRPLRHKSNDKMHQAYMNCRFSVTKFKFYTGILKFFLFSSLHGRLNDLSPMIFRFVVNYVMQCYRPHGNFQLVS